MPLTFQRLVCLAVRLPERFRGGCAFGVMTSHDLSRESEMLVLCEGWGVKSTATFIPDRLLGEALKHPRSCILPCPSAQKKQYPENRKSKEHHADDG